jgi:hypothetical protein
VAGRAGPPSDRGGPTRRCRRAPVRAEARWSRSSFEDAALPPSSDRRGQPGSPSTPRLSSPIVRKNGELGPSAVGARRGGSPAALTPGLDRLPISASAPRARDAGARPASVIAAARPFGLAPTTTASALECATSGSRPRSTRRTSPACRTSVGSR